MASVKKNMSFIKLLSTTDDRQRAALLKTMTNQQLEFLRQVIRNILEEVLVVPRQVIKNLEKYAKCLRDFADSKVKGRRERCLKLKKILPYIINTVLPQLELLT